MQWGGVPKKYLLESAMMRGDPAKTVPQFSLERYISSHYFRKAKVDGTLKHDLIMPALQFLQSDIKKCPEPKQSDLIVCYLDVFSQIFPQALEQDNIENKKVILVEFDRICDILIKQHIAEDYFKYALVCQILFVLKKAVHEEELASMAIYMLQNTLNSIGPQDSVVFLDRAFGILATGYLKFNKLERMQRYTSRIF